MRASTRSSAGVNQGRVGIEARQRHESRDARFNLQLAGEEKGEISQRDHVDWSLVLVDHGHIEQPVAKHEAQAITDGCGSLNTDHVCRSVGDRRQ
eukprot:CAMPEP_0115830176 /NCGR_PEP_ID=MMETSP0287-20121206/1485_1 /TAXON_ID=412157 /ORGANISM="Chrysochromulina rotalis, Strain UIO044" /LENGTH=94 /DNA_ID=CAMNT_0003283477 /DNA_START=174 /DNA_END=459 /DNA_ORIENTATION=-